MDVVTIVFGIVAVGAGGAAVWLALGRARSLAELSAAREREGALASELSEVRREAEERGEAEQELRASLARLEERLSSAEELRRQLEADRAQMRESFKSLAGDVLRASNEDFLKLAGERLRQQQQVHESELEKRRVAVEQLVKPIGETLAKTDEKLGQIEAARIEAFAKLGQHVTNVNEASAALREETAKLARALREPNVRGRYGELQLKRVAELAGMVAYCDFAEQTTARGDDGRLLRPDMTVELPNGRVIAVDAKTNIHAYLEALEARSQEETEVCLERFAKHVADQVTALSKKSYWSEFAKSPEFVVMFLPGDQFLDAALSKRRDLLERAAEQNVILVSPATLIGLLRAVAIGWREHRLAEEARELLALGRELHHRAGVAFDHAAKLGEAINRAVERYNSFASSVDARLIPTLRKFEETGVKSGKEIPDLAEITVRAGLLFGPAREESE